MLLSLEPHALSSVLRSPAPDLSWAFTGLSSQDEGQTRSLTATAPSAQGWAGGAQRGLLTSPGVQTSFLESGTPELSPEGRGRGGVIGANGGEAGLLVEETAHMKHWGFFGLGFFPAI